MTQNLKTFLIEKAEYMSCHRTNGETRLELFLIRKNIKFIPQYPIITSDGKGYIVDFLLPDNNMIIEVDGGYHTSLEQKKYDSIKDEKLKSLGYSIVRVTNKETEMLDGKFYEKITGLPAYKKPKKKKINYREEAKQRKKLRKQFYGK